MQFIDLNSQYSHLKTRIDSRIHQVLNHGQYINGPEVKELELRLQEYLNVKHAICCGNGTDAIVLGLLAMGVGKGDTVLCPDFTFFATAEAIAFCGATPVFVDCDPHTFNLCSVSLEKVIIKLQAQQVFPKVIITVDLFGLPADYTSINIVAKKYGMQILEDAAQGFGGAIDSVKACNFGNISTTSFFPSKPLGCYGDGGAIFTNSDDYADVLRSLTQHGKGIDKYDNIRIGMNSRLDTIQAAILLEKLEVFPRELALRNEVAFEYVNKLHDYVQTPEIPSGFVSSWAQFTIKSTDRDKIIKYLNNKQIPSMIYYQKCMHQQKAFDHLKKTLSVPVKPKNSIKLVSEVLSLPIHPYLTKKQIHTICDELASSLK